MLQPLRQHKFNTNLIVIFRRFARPEFYCLINFTSQVIPENRVSPQLLACNNFCSVLAVSIGNRVIKAGPTSSSPNPKSDLKPNQTRKSPKIRLDLKNACTHGSYTFIRITNFF